MYALMSNDIRLPRRVAHLLGERVVVLPTWSDMRRAIGSASLGMLALPDLSDPSDRLELRRLDDLRGGVPLLLLTRLDRRNGVVLADLGTRMRVVWLDEIESTLRHTVDEVVASAPQRRLLETVRNAEVSAWLRRALVLAVRAEPPVRSIQRWSELSACSISTLEYHWRRDISSRREGFRPKDFLDHLLVYRACTLLRTEKSAAAAHRLGIHQRTLERMARRLGYGAITRLRSLSLDDVTKRVASELSAVSDCADR